MKKVKKINLNLNKEIISSLTESDLSQIKGGYYTEITQCDSVGCQPENTRTCPQSVSPCKLTIGGCVTNVITGCIPIYTAGITCKSAACIKTVL